MSSLSDKLNQLNAPRKPLSFINWFSSLSKEDQDAAWESLSNGTLKNYTIYGIFRTEGLRMSKDNFVAFRKEVLSGKMIRTDIDE